MLTIDRWVQYYQDLLIEHRSKYNGTKNNTPTQIDRGIVEVSEERVRKAVIELKWEIMWTRRNLH